MHEDKILINELTGQKAEVIGQLFKRLAADNFPQEQTAVLEEILQREERLSSCVGEGVAIPHAKVAGLKELRLGLATSHEGIETPEDEDKVHLMFLLLAPAEKNALMLQALAAVSRLCHSKENRDALSQIKSPGRILKMIEETGIEVKNTICASDIMHDNFTQLNPEMVLAEAVKVMASLAATVPENCDMLPVTDEKGELLGELSGADLLKTGLPHYVGLLSDDAFLDNFEPFERFFSQRMTLTVEETMNREVIAMPSDCPITKVAHELAHQDKVCAYVVEDKKLVGVIHRQDFLTRILQL